MNRCRISATRNDANGNRRRRARIAIRAYRGRTGRTHPDEVPETVTDLITDLTHLVGLDAMARAWSLAQLHYVSEGGVS